MEPTLHSGELLRLDHKLPGNIPRGTIVLVTKFGQAPVIKRVIGLPNETVSFELGEVFVNGKMLQEPYLPEPVITFSWNATSISARSEQYILLGDNRPASLDSRDFGPVGRNRIVGRLNINSAPSRFLDHPRFRITKDGIRPSRQTVGYLNLSRNVISPDERILIDSAVRAIVSSLIVSSI